MKNKKLVLVLITMLVVFAAVMLVILKQNAFFVLRQFNKASSTDLSLGDSAENIDTEVYREYNDGFFGFSMYRKSDACCELKVSSFPDAFFGSARVTGIYITDENADMYILGIKVGSNAKDLYAAVKALGYKIEKGSEQIVVARKGKLTIKAEIEDNTVTKISATLASSNILRIQY